MSESRILVAACEERFNRIKHYWGFPHQALSACMGSIGITSHYLPKRVIINQMPSTDNRRIVKEIWPALDDEKIMTNPSHHLLHAMYAHISSGFSDSAHLVLDGSGYSYAEYLRNKASHIHDSPLDQEACESLSIFYINGDTIEVIHKDWGIWVENTPQRFRFPSLGHMYSWASQIIFGDWTHAGKVMGLAPYGNYKYLDFDIVKLQKMGIDVDTDWALRFSSIEAGDSYEINDTACNIAAKVQNELEKSILHLARVAKKSIASPNLCISGGVALNSAANGKLVDADLFNEIHFAPAAGDSGTSIGAAAYGVFIDEGRIPTLENYSDFLGPVYLPQTRKEAIESCQYANVNMEKVDNPARTAAQDIANGLVVGWFEGRSEFGPRALGNRSILADPRISNIKDILNSRIKFRESFRPFAVAILEELAPDWFKDSVNNEFMLVVRQFKEKLKHHVPGAVHVDNSCRVQTVSKDLGSMLRKVLEEFYQSTGIPMVINTSLNRRGEPLCELPNHAIDCFIGSDMDVLFLDGIRVTKTGFISSISVPQFSEKINLRSDLRVLEGIIDCRFTLHAPDRPEKMDITEEEYKVLKQCYGKSNLVAISNECGVPLNQCLIVANKYLNKNILAIKKQ